MEQSVCRFYIISPLANRWKLEKTPWKSLRLPSCFLPRFPLNDRWRHRLGTWQMALAYFQWHPSLKLCASIKSSLLKSYMRNFLFSETFALCTIYSNKYIFPFCLSKPRMMEHFHHFTVFTLYTWRMREWMEITTRALTQKIDAAFNSHADWRSVEVGSILRVLANFTELNSSRST